MELFSKIRQTLSIILHKSALVNQSTYYPDCEQKSKMQILSDHLYFVWKYGMVEPFYFTYGFDRKEMTRERMINDYIVPYNLFQRRINYLNFNNPKYGNFHGRVITGDKFYFNVFLERFGIPTPKVYCYIRKKKPMYIDPMFCIDSSLPAECQLNDFLSNEMDAFVKPSAGQLGKGVFALRIQDNLIYIDGKETPKAEVVGLLLSSSYLIQERIYQHPKLASLCSSSINSIRLQTVMDKDGEIHAFGAGLRIGREGSTADNWAKGGVFVGIDMKTGLLMENGFLKPRFGTSTKEHPDSHVVFKNFEIPFYKEAETLAVKLHGFLYRCHSVGWDIAITEYGPVFIEGNGLWEISLLQAAHGGLRKEVEKWFY